jgi:hypothetical protein
MLNGGNLGLTHHEPLKLSLTTRTTAADDTLTHTQRKQLQTHLFWYFSYTKLTPIMPRRGRKRKKTRTHVVDTDERIKGALLSQDENKIPRSLVVSVASY